MWIAWNDSNVAPYSAKIYDCYSINWRLSIRSLERWLLFRPEQADAFPRLGFEDQFFCALRGFHDRLDQRDAHFAVL